MLPEIVGSATEAPCLTGEYSSARDVMSLEDTSRLLEEHYLMLRDVVGARGEVLR
jgi:hypothetical protein